jgi:outer membrane protein OmpA-like peptidoglycan-associated protein
MTEATPQKPSAVPSGWKDETRRSKAPLIVLLILVLLGLSATLYFLETQKSKNSIPLNTSAERPPPLDVTPVTPSNKATDALKEAEDALKITGSVPQMPQADDPIDLITSIGNALANQDFATAEKLIGEKALDDATRQRLKQLGMSAPLKLRAPHPVREVGELELNKKARYALELAEREAGRDRIYFDLIKNGKLWEVEKITLPPTDQEAIPRALLIDSLGITDAFLLAVLNQDFVLAKEFVNTQKVSDATLAGLCILFEEGNYRLRPAKPLRAVLQKETLASYLANVEAADGTEAAQFAIMLKKSEAQADWIIDELNLDQLLSDYAQRFAGGDVHYTPLIKNPAGGDTLVLYFEFDEERLTLRTERQLSIVAMILKTDTNKKIHLAGHTDALGSADYNQGLSLNRAIAVREYLISTGVNPAQIITAAKGLTEPRRPNVKATGEDDPAGRRANRRTEIYLDF